MGLDVTAHEILTPIPGSHSQSCTMDPDEAWESGHHHVFVHQDFPKSFAGFTHTEAGQHNWIVGTECYQASGEPLKWRAGSYSGYGDFRESLAAYVGVQDIYKVWDSPEQYEEIPFFEIIHFADNEGWIGPSACARLAADFEQHKDAYLALRVGEWFQHRYWSEKYSAFLDGFKLAAHTGGVNFH